MLTSYELIDGRPTLRFQRQLEHPVAAVWHALTDPAELANWFPSAIAGELRQGEWLSFSFPGHEDVPDMDGRVTELDPPRTLALDWGEDHLRFELAPADGGAATVLRFTVALGTNDKAARDGAGWTVCLERLAAVLRGADAQELEAISGGWRRHYDEYERRGLPATAPIPNT